MPTCWAGRMTMSATWLKTVALIWPPKLTNRAPPILSEVVADITAAKRSEDAGASIEALAGRLQRRSALCPAEADYRRACASAYRRDWRRPPWPNGPARRVNEIEEVWHGLEPPYAELFEWLEGKGAAA